MDFFHPALEILEESGRLESIDYTVIQTLFRGLRPEIFSAAVTLPAGKRKQLVFRAGQRDTAGFSKVYFAAMAFSTSF